MEPSSPDGKAKEQAKTATADVTMTFNPNELIVCGETRVSILDADGDWTKPV